MSCRSIRIQNELCISITSIVGGDALFLNFTAPLTASNSPDMLLFDGTYNFLSETDSWAYRYVVSGDAVPAPGPISAALLGTGLVGLLIGRHGRPRKPVAALTSR